MHFGTVYLQCIISFSKSYFVIEETLLLNNSLLLVVGVKLIHSRDLECKENCVGMWIVANPNNILQK